MGLSAQDNPILFDVAYRLDLHKVFDAKHFNLLE
jgi:hypothetical protein